MNNRIGQSNPNWKGGKKIYSCKICGKKFTSYQKRQYCSIKCNLQKPKVSHKINKICSVCNTSFQVYPYKIKRKKGIYCSRKCSSQEIGKKISITRKKLFQINPTNKTFLGKGKNCRFWKGGLVKIKCQICGKIFETKPSRLKKGLGKYCSRKCYREWWNKNIRPNIPPPSPERWRKENNPNWKGGITSEIDKRTQTPEWHKTRKQIYQRDKWTCQICKKHCEGKRIQCHHIVPYRISQDDSLGNLITLCINCHMKEEHKYYQLLGQKQLTLF